MSYNQIIKAKVQFNDPVFFFAVSGRGAWRGNESREFREGCGVGEGNLVVKGGQEHWREAVAARKSEKRREKVFTRYDSLLSSKKFSVSWLRFCKLERKELTDAKPRNAKL